MAGRRPKPRWLKLVQGNPGKRSMKREPTPRVRKNYPPPAGLTAREQGHWRQIAAPLQACGAISDADLVALAEAARVSAKLEELRAEDMPLLVKSRRSGLQRVNPAWNAVMALQKRLIDLLCQFGATPVSRARVAPVDESSAVDPFEAFVQSGASLDADDSGPPVPTV